MRSQLRKGVFGLARIALIRPRRGTFMESVMRRYEHHREVGAICDACARPVHLAKSEDGGWFWMHDSTPSRAQVAAHRQRGVGLVAVSESRAAELIGGGRCTQTT